MPEKEENTHQLSLPLNQPTESYSALKTWKWILSVHLLFCAHAKRNKNLFSFVMQMGVGYLEIGLYFLNAMELQCFLGVASGGSKGGNTVAYTICCLNATYTNLSTISEVCWSPRAAMISALVCLWAGTARSIAGGDKWAEVPQSLWHFAWHQRLGLQKSLVWSTHQRMRLCFLMQISARPRLWCAAVGQGQLGLCFPKHHYWAHGSMQS